MADDERISGVRAPIRIECILPGREGQHVLFRSSGWKFRHLRAWEEAQGAGELAKVVSERIESWHILDENGEAIPFRPFISRNDVEVANPGVFDELPPEIASWLVTVYRQAYGEAGRPNPNG